jgi:EpsI family protein
VNRDKRFSFAVTIALLLATIATCAISGRRIPEPLALPLDQISNHIAGWTEISQGALDPDTLRALDPTSYLVRTYQKGDSQIGLFIAYYAQQRAGESMHSPNHCLPGAGWEIMQRRSVIINALGRQVPINAYLIENFGSKKVMFYWYQSRDRIVANEYWAKLLLARDTALTGRTGGSIVRILLPDNAAASRDGIAFASSLIPEMQRCLIYKR